MTHKMVGSLGVPQKDQIEITCICIPHTRRGLQESPILALNYMTHKMVGFFSEPQKDQIEIIRAVTDSVIKFLVDFVGSSSSGYEGKLLTIRSGRLSLATIHSVPPMKRRRFISEIIGKKQHKRFKLRNELAANLGRKKTGQERKHV